MATMLELLLSSSNAGSKGIFVRRPCWTGNSILKIWLHNNKLPEFGILQTDVGESGRVPLTVFDEYNDFIKVIIIIKKVKANENKRKRSSKKAITTNTSSGTRRTRSYGRKSTRNKGKV